MASLTCPECHRGLPGLTDECPWCGRELDPEALKRAALQQRLTRHPKPGNCFLCDAEMPQDVTDCPACGATSQRLGTPLYSQEEQFARTTQLIHLLGGSAAENQAAAGILLLVDIAEDIRRSLWFVRSELQEIRELLISTRPGPN